MQPQAGRTGALVWPASIQPSPSVKMSLRVPTRASLPVPPLAITFNLLQLAVPRDTEEACQLDAACFTDLTCSSVFSFLQNYPDAPRSQTSTLSLACFFSCI
jgi:hypothetical protein